MLDNSYEALVHRVCELLPTGYARYNFEEHISPVFSYEGEWAYYRYRAVDGEGDEYYKTYKGQEWFADTLYEIGRSNLNAYLVAHLFIYVFIREYKMFLPRFGATLNKWERCAESEIKGAGFRWHKNCSRFINYPSVDYEQLGQIDPECLAFAELVVHTIDESLKLSVIERWLVEKRECV